MVRFERVVVSRAVHGSGQIRFRVNLHSTQVTQVNVKWTRNRPYVQIKTGGSGHRLSGSKPSNNFGFETKEEN